MVNLLACPMAQVGVQIPQRHRSPAICWIRSPSGPAEHKHPFVDEPAGFDRHPGPMAPEKASGVWPLPFTGVKIRQMNSRLQRLEFVTLYDLYIKKNEEFRRAVQEQRDPVELDNLRASLQDIYQKLAEKRGTTGREVSNE